MEAQQDQQPTSSATARPQQPTNAPAASLPLETLAQIFDLAIEGLDRWEAQTRKLELAKTCVEWYSAADMGRAFDVADTMKAERLGEALREQGDERMEKEGSLYIAIEGVGEFLEDRVAALLSACPRLARLELQVWHRIFPPPGRLAEALQSLASVVEFRLTSNFETNIMAADLHALVSSWPHLETNEFRGIITRVSEHQQFPALPPRSLTRLRLPLFLPFPDEILAPILASSSTTLRHLQLDHKFPSVVMEPSDVPPNLAPLVSVAPQLLTFSAVSDGRAYHPSGRPEYWWPVLCALRDVETLRLGLLGYNVSEVLPPLQQLQHLTTLTISYPRQAWKLGD